MEIDGTMLEQVKQFNYLGFKLSLEGEPDFDNKMNRSKNICGTIGKHLKKTHAYTQMKFYKVVARLTLPYGSETWVTTMRDMTRLEAAEMRFLRSVKGYTRLDKIRSEIIRKLEISGIQEVSTKHKIGSTNLKEWITLDS
jgi:23S rRNA A1618 N6-methylase RlmF